MGSASLAFNPSSSKAERGGDCQGSLGKIWTTLLLQVRKMRKRHRSLCSWWDNSATTTACLSVLSCIKVCISSVHWMKICHGLPLFDRQVFYDEEAAEVIYLLKE